MSKVQCFNDFLQALKSKLEDKALSDFWEIMVQGTMALKIRQFLVVLYIYPLNKKTSLAVGHLD